MTEVEFHTGVADPTAFACRLLRKACRAGVRVLVTASPAPLVALDRALWTFAERDFVPHVNGKLLNLWSRAGRAKSSPSNWTSANGRWKHTVRIL